MVMYPEFFLFSPIAIGLSELPPLRWLLFTGLWGEDLRSNSGLEPWSQDAIGQAVLSDQ